MILLLTSTIVGETFKVLVALLATVATGVIGYLMKRISDLEDEIEKQRETNNMLLNRIFGVQKDPTDEGYIMETEQRFDKIEETLQEIQSMQKESMRERREEHERVDSKISSIISVMEKNEEIDVESEDFES
jgi:predicted  nucleic acid-binding Zn-ribbon protein